LRTSSSAENKNGKVVRRCGLYQVLDVVRLSAKALSQTLTKATLRRIIRQRLQPARLSIYSPSPQTWEEEEEKEKKDR
jgi:hypothetical protein